MKKKRARRAPKKIHLIFDEDERRDFLTGFQKRKKERQKKAQEEIKARVQEEKRRLRAEVDQILALVRAPTTRAFSNKIRRGKLADKREVLQKLLEDRPLPCSEDDGKPVTYDMADHTVTVTSLDSGQQFLADRLDEAVKEGRAVDSHKRRLKALDHKMGQCSRPMAKWKKGPKKRRRQ